MILELALKMVKMEKLDGMTMELKNQRMEKENESLLGEYWMQRGRGKVQSNWLAGLT